MDAFAFDQKFARFVAQVDSQAMRQGAELYESGAATVRRLSATEVEGSVTDGRFGVYRVQLTANDEGGLSGRCDCDAVFNCRHSYALARAARDRATGRAVGDAPARLAKPKIPVESSTAAALAERLGISGATPQLRQIADALDRVFRLAQQSGWLVYPRDLQALAKNRRRPDLPPNEPLRELKRALGASGAANALAFAEALQLVCEYKGVELDPLLARPAGAASASGSPRSPALAAPARTPSWDEEPLRLRYETRLERSSERDWFQLSARIVIEGDGYTEEETRQLVAANGELTQLKGKGWRRARLDPADPVAAALRALGVDPLRGNAQRVHACQLETLKLPESAQAGSEWSAARKRARALAELTPPPPPPFLQGVLRPYQVEGYQFLCRLTQLGLGGLLADDMGLGKTLQTLAWLCWQGAALPEKTRFRALIVCPKSVVDNWVQEPRKFKAPLRATAFRPDLIGSEELEQSDLVVANYAQLRLRSDYFLAQRWDVAILDEGQYIKSPDAQTTKSAYALQAGQRLILTGTPIENRLLDLWSLMRFALPRLLGPRAAFAANYGSGDNPESLAGLRERIRPFMLRRLKSEVAKDLPARMEEELRCEMEGEQAALYAKELTAARAALKAAKKAGGAKGTAHFNVLQSLLRLRQICCDPALIGAPLPDGARPAKMQALLDLLEPLVAEGHKVLVFSQFVAMLERIQAELAAARIGNLLLTGQTRDRQKMVDRFQSPEGEPVFLLSLKAAGSGLNLTAASYVALFDPWWNPAVEAQAIDRAHRIGQANRVMAYRILAKDTVEEKIRSLQREKAALADSVAAGDDFAVALSLEEIGDLLSE